MSSYYVSSFAGHQTTAIPVALSVETPPDWDEKTKEIFEKIKQIFAKASWQSKGVEKLLTSFEQDLKQQSDKAFQKFLKIETAYKEANFCPEEMASLLAELTVFPSLLLEGKGSIRQINTSYMTQLKLNPEAVTYLNLSSLSHELSNEKLADLLAQFPYLLHLVLDGAIHLTPDSFTSIFRCHNLVILSLKSCSTLLKWETALSGSLSRLKVLNLSYLSEIKPPVISWVNDLGSLNSLDVTCSSHEGVDFTPLKERGVVIKE